MTTTITDRLTIDDIAPLTVDDPGTRAGRGDPDARTPIIERRFGRRGALKTVVLLGTTAGFMTLGVFPKSKQAAAACVSSLENTIAGGCPVGVGDCSPACGPSMVNQAACNGDAWHRWTGNYRNRPNDCNSTGSDGWRWTVQGCGCGSCFRPFRCHDGCTNFGSGWTNTICRQQGSACAC